MIEHLKSLAAFRNLKISNIRQVHQIYQDGDKFIVNFDNNTTWAFLTDRPDIFSLCFEIMIATSAIPSNFRNETLLESRQDFIHKRLIKTLHSYKRL